jgi:hypothetical protein
MARKAVSHAPKYHPQRVADKPCQTAPKYRVLTRHIDGPKKFTMPHYSQGKNRGMQEDGSQIFNLLDAHSPPAKLHPCTVCGLDHCSLSREAAN